MSKARVRRTWVTWVLLGIVVTLALEMAGAIMHTVILAVFNETVESYLWKRWQFFSISHVVLRGIAAALVLFMVEQIDDYGFQVKYAIVVWIVSAIVLEVVDFSAYLVEFLATAVWSGITGGRTVTLRNVIGCDYRDALDVVSRLCQGFVVVFSWWIRTKKRDWDFSWRREDNLLDSIEELEATNEKLLEQVNKEVGAKYVKLEEAVDALLTKRALLRTANRKQERMIRKLTSALNAQKNGRNARMLPPPQE